MAFAGLVVEALVASGGMGSVYRATDPTLRRTVALKVIAPILAEDPRFRDRFLVEGRLAASLEHPAIVPAEQVRPGLWSLPVPIPAAPFATPHARPRDAGRPPGARPGWDVDEAWTAPVDGLAAIGGE